MIVLAIVALVLALLPALMTIKNLSVFRDPSKEEKGTQGHPDVGVSVLIPARNEEGSIGDCLRSILQSTHPNLEVIVVDDHSEDGTAKIIDDIALLDSRVKRHMSAPLPEGWNGKQHACWQASQLASNDRLLFLDADVRLSPVAISCCLWEMSDSESKLVSGFPYQETGTIAENY